MYDNEQINLAMLNETVERIAERMSMNIIEVRDVLFDYFVIYKGSKNASAIVARIYEYDPDIVKRIAVCAREYAEFGKLHDWYPLVRAMQTDGVIDPAEFEEFRSYIYFRVRNYPLHKREDIFSGLIQRLVTTKTVAMPYTTEKLIFTRLLNAIREVKRQSRDLPVEDAEAVRLPCESRSVTVISAKGSKLLFMKTEPVAWKDDK